MKLVPALLLAFALGMVAMKYVQYYNARIACPPPAPILYHHVRGV